MYRNLNKFICTTLLVLILSFISNSLNIAFATDKKGCLVCHKYPGLVKYEQPDTFKVLHIDEDKQLASSHNKTDCKECHPKTVQIPHTNVTEVDCTVKCHSEDKEEINGLENIANFFGDDFVFNSHKYLAGKTPTGGIHLLFKWDDDYKVKTTSNILPGIDTRGTGGQIIVAPSSRNINGEWLEYRWNNIDLPISPMQPWCYKFIEMVGQKDDGSV